MRLLARMQSLVGWRGRPARAHPGCGIGPSDMQVKPSGAREIELRIVGALMRDVRAHVEDFTRGEEAGFLVCSLTRLPGYDRLLAREFIPVPDWAIERYTGSVLSWAAEFNSQALKRAVDLDATLVLVHSHGATKPHFSRDDRKREVPLFAAFSRIVNPLPTGTLVLGDGAAAGSFWLDGRNDLVFRRVVIIAQTLQSWHSSNVVHEPRPPRRRLDRQDVGIPGSDALLADARIAVVGLSGGGSHVIQQLAHLGVGTLIAVDDQVVEETNLGRLVGATERDVDACTPKTDLAERVVEGVDSSSRVIKVPHQFPSREAIAALKQADVVVSTLDTFRARDAVNRFCRRHLIPQIDIGMIIRTRQETLTLAQGQVIVSIPGLSSCLHCWFTDAKTLADEERERPAGYDRDPDAAGDPQVVSMNGALASEACNCVLDLITGYSGGARGPKIWRYEGRAGVMEQGDPPSRRPDCDACAEQGLGDASPAWVAVTSD
jgi:molybdopterin/thiamine biosynthesis adenylyltransferase